MKFSVEVAGTVQLSTALADRKLEPVLARTAGELPESQIGETLFRDALVVVTAASNPLARKRMLTLAQLVEEPWTLEPPNTFFGGLSAMAFSGAGLNPPTATILTNSRNFQNALLETGRFLSILPAYILKLPRKHPTLRALAIELPHTFSSVQVITPRHRSLSPLAKLFIERVRAISRPLAQGSNPHTSAAASR